MFQTRLDHEIAEINEDAFTKQSVSAIATLHRWRMIITPGGMRITRFAAATPDCTAGTID
jgi:hypothetical protein